MKVYVLGDGCYSDYAIRGICSTKKKAIELKEKFGFEHDPEEFELDSLELIPSKPVFFVRMDKEGNTTEVESRRTDDYGWYNVMCAFEKEFGFDADEDLYMTVFADDKKHAVKIVNEKRGRLIANNKWGVKK